MLRITPSEAGANQVKKYYVHPSSQEAYYSEGQDFNGIWGGKGAARLGLSGSLQEGAFSRLCDNLHPFTGEKLTLRMKENRRVGYDVNFHVPKSVSLAYFHSKDERILQAVRQTAHETLLDMQENADVRVRKDGRDEDRPTGELVWAEFPHMTARPVGCVPDPHLHIHCYVFNATYDQAEDAWKALQFGRVMEEADYYQKAFHARLATKLKGLGLEIESTDVAFEVAGVTRALIEKFSRRTKTINAEAIRRGVTDPVEKAKLGALTREKKIQDVPLSELEPIWWARLTVEEAKVLEAIKADLQRTREKAVVQSREEPASSEALGTGKAPIQPERTIVDEKGRPVSKNRATWPVESKAVQNTEPTKADLKAVRFAVEHLFERQSVVTEKQLIAEAFESWSYGQATLEGVTQAIRDWPLIRVQKDGRTLITTQEVLAEEKRIIKKCKTGKGQYSYLNLTWQIEGTHLNEQQRNAVYHVLRSADFVTGISGKAGTGKTTLLKEAQKGIQAAGRHLWVFAPTAEAARDTLRKEGFDNAETIAQLLSSKRIQKEAAGAVWWVDEAGLMSSRSMDKLLSLAEELNARVVLVGDTGQHHAVERGQAFYLLQKYGEMAIAEVDEIQRQKGLYKTAVELISEKKFEAGFEVLEQMKAISEIELQAERERAVARDYVDARELEESAQVVCPTHKEGRSVTQAIRHEMKERDLLGEGRKWHILRNLAWTTAQKRDARHYEPGLIVQVNRPVKGFAVGERLEVVDSNNNRVSVRGSGEQPKELPLSHPEHFNVYERDAIEICSGEKIRITANGRSADRHPLSNGNCYTVREFTADGQLVLNNGWRLGKDCPHLDYGYVTTSHVAQSKTVDRVFVVQSAALSAGATNVNQFYVSVSRGRKGVKIYTDNLELLRENVARVRERKMALEIVVPPTAECLGPEREVKGLADLAKAVREQETLKNIALYQPARETGKPELLEIKKHITNSTAMPRKSGPPRREMEFEMEM
ncbi:MAG TPA: MobF family relaxase [Clostridia bacterium]|nr:MobF family relaxase [Clostridia bacterium]